MLVVIRSSMLLFFFNAMFLCAPLADEKPEKLILNHLSHPQIETFKTLLTNAYGRLGITLIFVNLSSERGLLSVDSGLIDGDVVRHSDRIKGLDNILIVQPPLTRAQSYLICHRDVPCNLNVLEKPLSIFATRQLERSFRTLYPDKQHVRIVETERYSLILNLINNGRAQYGLFDTAPDTLPEQLGNNIQFVYLNSFNAHHILHKKHANLMTEIELAIQLELNAIQPDKTQ